MEQRGSERISTRLLVRPSEAAELIGVSRSKVYELIASGVLPSVRLDGGRLIRVPMAALEQLAQRALGAKGSN